MRKAIITLTLLTILALTITSLTTAENNEFSITGDLLRVTVKSELEADQLRSSGAVPVLRVSDGYLVLADPQALSSISGSSLKYEQLASALSRDQMALDRGLQDVDMPFEILYSENQLKLYRVDPAQKQSAEYENRLIPLPGKLDIIYRKPVELPDLTSRGIMDLETLISNVSQDSLESYTYRLEAFYRRYAGTDSNRASRDWIAGKFTEFGYDSVYLDTFTSVIGSTMKELYNVVAVKTGTVLPDHHVIVGGHFDGVYNSPAANDNGSGTAATIEFARVLKDIDTDLSFVFILFDAEEHGLYGSYHYADEAYAQGDSIVYMFNMDMISHLTNTNQCKLYHGTDQTYTDLFIDLADSLLGITSYKQGNLAGSDHYPFSQNGWPVTFLHEYNFSNVYHSPQDSTTYMNFEYMTDMSKAGLATVYMVSQTYALPSVSFAYPQGIPDQISPDQNSFFIVEVNSVNNGIPVPNSGQLHYSIDDGPVTSVDLNMPDPDVYHVYLPLVDCNSRLEFYITAEEQENGVFYDTDPDNPHVAYSMVDVHTSIQDNFESDAGWTTEVAGASSGFWQRGVPVNDASWDYDPASDADGSGQCYLTQNQYGNTDVDDGAVRLISPPVDLSVDGAVSYSYFLKLTDSDGSDKLLVEANDGTSGWKEIARHDQDNDLAWTSHTIPSSTITAAGVSLTDQMQFRFTANDGGTQSIVEAGIDAFKVKEHLCETPPELKGLVIKQNDSTLVNVINSNVIGALELGIGDTLDQLEVWFRDMDDSLVRPNTEYNFMQVTQPDQIADLEIINDYDLVIEGLQAGLNNISFSVVFTDDIPAYSSPEVQLIVSEPYLCGDVNDDDAVDISDAIFIINYAFAGGPAPDPLESADVNCDSTVEVSDAVYIINFAFAGGSTPCDPDGDSIPDC
jgi:aminopeptidase YwaD